MKRGSELNGIVIANGILEIQPKIVDIVSVLHSYASNPRSAEITTRESLNTPHLSTQLRFESQDRTLAATRVTITRNRGLSH